MKTYYYIDKENKKIEVSLEELIGLIKQNKLDEDSLIWTDGWKDWKKIKDVEELKEYLKIPPPIPPNLPPPIPPKKIFDLANINSMITEFIHKFKYFLISFMVLLFIVFTIRTCDNENKSNSNSQLDNVEISNLSDNERSKIIQNSLDFHLVNQLNNGQVTIEVTNKSEIYSFEFNKLYLPLHEINCWIYPCNKSYNPNVKLTVIKPNQTVRVNTQIKKGYEIKEMEMNLLKDKKFTKIFKQ